MESFNKLKKTTAFLDQAIETSFLTRFGIPGIQYATLEQVYDPTVSGFGSLHQARKHLVKNGMTK